MRFSYGEIQKILSLIVSDIGLIYYYLFHTLMSFEKSK